MYRLCQWNTQLWEYRGRNPVPDSRAYDHSQLYRFSTKRSLNTRPSRFLPPTTSTQFMSSEYTAPWSSRGAGGVPIAGTSSSSGEKSFLRVRSCSRLVHCASKLVLPPKSSILSLYLRAQYLTLSALRVIAVCEASRIDTEESKLLHTLRFRSQQSTESKNSIFEFRPPTSMRNCPSIMLTVCFIRGCTYTRFRTEKSSSRASYTRFRFRASLNGPSRFSIPFPPKKQKLFLQWQLAKSTALASVIVSVRRENLLHSPSLKTAYSQKGMLQMPPKTQMLPQKECMTPPSLEQGFHPFTSATLHSKLEYQNRKVRMRILGYYSFTGFVFLLLTLPTDDPFLGWYILKKAFLLSSNRLSAIILAMVRFCSSTFVMVIFCGLLYRQLRILCQVLSSFPPQLLLDNILN